MKVSTHCSNCGKKLFSPASIDDNHIAVCYRCADEMPLRKIGYDNGEYSKEVLEEWK